MNKQNNFEKQYIEILGNRAKLEKDEYRDLVGDRLVDPEKYPPFQPLLSFPSDFECRDSLIATLLYLSGDLLNIIAYPLLDAYRITESPIEKYMLFAITIIACRNATKVTFVVNGREDGYDCNYHDTQISIEPQAKIGDYRVDFLVRVEEAFFTPNEGTRTTNLVIECDGHEYHEMTKEQAARDKKRDRELQKKGYSIFRFSGSEIWKDAIECAENSIKFLRDKAKNEYFEKPDLT